jgi:hypothetical protein
MIRRLLPASIVAGAVAICLLGAASAWAVEPTTLCESSHPSQICPNAYPRFTLLKMTGSVSVTGSENFSCTGSTIVSETKTAAGAPLLAKVFTFTLSGCTNNGNTCTTTVGPSILEAQIETIGSDNGTMRIVKPAGTTTNPEMEFSCGAVVCTYSTAEIKFSITGGAPATALTGVVPLTLVSGTSCSPFAKLTAKYTFTNPSPMYVEHT